MSPVKCQWSLQKNIKGARLKTVAGMDRKKEKSRWADNNNTG